MSKKKKAENNQALTVTGHEPPSSFAVTLIRGENGHVSLPVKTELANDTAAQEAVVVRVLPQGVRREVLRQLQAEEERRSPAQWALIIAILTISLTIVWWYFPWKMSSAKSFRDGWGTNEDPIPKDSEYYELYIRSKKYYESKDYDKCATQLSQVIQKILKNQKSDDHSLDILLEYFFESVYLGNVRSEIKEIAKGNIKNLAERKRNDAKWGILCLELGATEFLNVEELYGKLITGEGNYDKKWQEKLDEIQEWIKYTQGWVSSIEKLVKDDSSQETVEKLFRLKYSRACLFTAKWMLKNGEGKSEFPDRMKIIGSRKQIMAHGVYYRYEALKICDELNDNNSPISKVERGRREFLKLRLFIVNTVKEQSKHRMYHWNHEWHFFKDDLDNEIQDIQIKLNGEKS